jgi:hypothetical protein
VRVHILSNNPQIQTLPWEYIQEPDFAPGPRLERSVVRVVSTVGIPRPEPLKFENRVRVLFTYADPPDQTLVNWPAVKESLEQSFAGQLPHDKFDIDIFGEITPARLAYSVQQSQYEIFHFCGHGMVEDGIGRLILHNSRNESSYISCEDLLVILRGCGIRLVIFSACNTSAGNFNDKFAVIAEALIREGIPAVVANQFPIPNETIPFFIGPLYTELLRSGDIDKAVSKGRIMLRTLLAPADLAQSQKAVLDWGIPTLYRHIDGAKVFES